MGDTSVSPGDAVLTKFGVGVVVRCFNGNLEDNLTSNPRGQSNGQEGAGNENKENVNASTDGPSWAVVRLWRKPGKSMASADVATLNTDCIIKKIVAAPGMVVRADTSEANANNNDKDDNTEKETSSESSKESLFLIERYIQSKDVFLASSMGNPSGKNGSSSGYSLARSLAVISSGNAQQQTTPANENGQSKPDGKSSNPTKVAADAKSRACEDKKYIFLKPDQINSSSTSAKFYPVLEDLIQKGEKAFSLAMEKSAASRQPMKDVTNALSSTVTINSPSGEKAIQDLNISSENVAKFISDTSKSSIETLHSKISPTDEPEVIKNGNGDAPSTPSKLSITTTAGDALSKASTNAAAATSAAMEGVSLPQAQEIKQIYQMLRDEDLTVLFEKGRERLKELVDTEIPTRTKKALSAVGIEIEEEGDGVGEKIDGGKQSIRGGVDKLRKEALASLEQILNITVDDEKNIVIATNKGATSADSTSIKINTQTIMDSNSLTSSPLLAQKQFSEMFDHLSTVARSDPKLLQIFSSISEKTKLWQEMTGRLLQTKTASLFMEGTQRLRSRAAHLLNVTPGKIRGAIGRSSASDSGGTEGDNDLTRAFTEGDVAIAKLKSMEMGDAIRNRLFEAIELRSESSGGLDSIIAGSLEALNRAGDTYSTKAVSLLENKGLENMSLSSGADAASAALSEDSIQSMISNLQRSATVAMKGTKETLIALLSQRSGYRDAVLLRLEQVFVDLESELGQDMSAEEIASIASGEGGTLALFQPVAMRAAKEIEKQLDAAEKSLKDSENWDPRAKDVMGKVRQITKGELSMMDIVDMAAGYLDDEEVATKGEGLIVQTEMWLDEFEAASGKLGKVNPSDAGGTAAAGIMDAVKKAGITKDEVMKHVESFDVNKLLNTTESVMTDEVARRELISSAGDTALDFLLKILPSMPVPPFDGVREGLVYHISNLSMAGFKVKKEDIFIEIAGIRAAAQKTENGTQTQTQSAVKASELLIIDIKDISASLDDAVWSFEQTYLPYLKGSGKANAKLWSGSIRLKFELRRRVVKMEEDPQTGEQRAIWEPVLCLNDRACFIGGIELVIQGESRITWIANKLTSLLKNPLRDYVVGVIITALTNNSGWLIDMLNKNLSRYWDLIMRTSSLKIEDLVVLEEHNITKAESINEEEVELVWKERVPLGLNILTNDESGYLKVIDLPRGTQARQVCLAKGLDPEIFNGSTIVSVNGGRYGPDSKVELFAALKDPSRPKSILFRLATKDDKQRLDKIIQKRKSPRPDPNTKEAANEGEGLSLMTAVKIIEQGDIGIKFSSTSDNFALAVRDFLRNSEDQPLAAERTGKISIGDLLTHINRSCVLGENGAGKVKAFELLEELGPKRPLSLVFMKPYIYNIVIEKDHDEKETFGGPSELLLTEVQPSAASKEKKIVLKDYALTTGAAESSGVFIGDNLVFINGVPVGAGCRLSCSEKPPPLNEVMKMLQENSPLALTFARAARQKSSAKAWITSSPLSLDIESAHTFSVEALDYRHLGCNFAAGYNGTDVVVKSINGVMGPFQKQMKAAKHNFIGCVLKSVDGEVVPSYMNSQLITNAITRRWISNGRIELSFCNEKHRDHVHNSGSTTTAPTQH